MKSAKLFGFRIPFWTKAQEKKAKKERDEQERRVRAIHAEAIATHQIMMSLAMAWPHGVTEKSTDYPTIKFPGDDDAK